MAEATQRLQQDKVRASMGMAVNVLALQRAMNLTKRQLQAQGLEPSHFSHRDLRVRAEAYLTAHREELIAEAKVVVDRWQREGRFGKRARHARPGHHVLISSCGKRSATFRDEDVGRCWSFAQELAQCSAFPG